MKSTISIRALIGFAVVLGLLLSTSVHAEAEHAALSLVRETTDRIITQIKQDREKIKSDSTQLTVLVDKIVLPHFDFRKMSSWVLGRYWRKADSKQKERFTVEFRQLLVRIYSKALLEGADKKIVFLPLRGKTDKPDRVTVRTEIEQDGGFPLPIDYKLHKKGDAWKVYDVVIDGISIVANYRTTFAKRIRKDGIDKLIASLVDRNQQGKK